MKDLHFENLFIRILPRVTEENHQQVKKWGVQDHEPSMWLTITAEEFGEMAKAILEHTFGSGKPDAVVKEAIQTATLCLKIAEMFDALNPESKIYGIISE